MLAPPVARHPLAYRAIIPGVDTTGTVPGQQCNKAGCGPSRKPGMTQCGGVMTLVKSLVKSLAVQGWKDKCIMASDKKVYVKGNSVEFQMDVTKDKTKGTPTHFIKVTCDVTGVTRDTMLQNNFSGSSMRVKLQNSYMRKQPESTLARYASEGYKTTWKDIDDGYASNPIDLLMMVSRDDFIESMSKLGIEREQAIRIYNHKHGFPVNPAPKTGDGNPTS